MNFQEFTNELTTAKDTAEPPKKESIFKKSRFCARRSLDLDAGYIDPAGQKDFLSAWRAKTKQQFSELYCSDQWLPSQPQIRTKVGQLNQNLSDQRP